MRPSVRVGLALLLCLGSWLLAALPTMAAGIVSTGISVLGQAAGPATAVAAMGATAYVGVGPHVLAVDISSPTAPRQVGQSAQLPGSVQRLAAAGSILYAVSSREGNPAQPTTLTFLDVHTPAQPLERGSLVYAETISSLAANGTALYLALAAPNGNGGRLAILDVANPAQPVVQATLALSAAPGALAVGPGVLYLQVGPAIETIGVSDPTAPALLGSFTLPPVAGVPPATALQLALAGSTLAVGEAGFLNRTFVGDLRLLDASDPAHLRQLGVLANIGSVSGLVLSGASADLLTSNGLLIVDVSTPAQPRQVGRLQSVTDSGALTRCGALVCVAGSTTTALTVVDPSVPAQPVAVGRLAGFFEADALARSGSTLFVGSEDTLSVLDVSDPDLPRSLGQLVLPSTVEAVAVQPPYVYVATMAFERAGQFVPGSLVVVDVANPAQPKIMGELDTSGTPRGVAVAGPTVYLAESPGSTSQPNGGGGLHVVDVSAPRQPEEVAFLPLAGASEQVVIAGSWAYVATQPYHGNEPSGMHIVSVADPRRPSETAFQATSGLPSIAIQGQYAYLGDDLGLQVDDLAQPGRSRVVATVPAPGSPAHLALSGALLWTGGGGAASVFDLTDPARPALRGVYQQNGMSTALLAQDDLAYAGAAGDGLWVLHALFPAMADQAPPPAVAHDGRYFAQTGYRIGDDAFWEYFSHRGGVRNFGYPTSRVFTLRGFPVQFFQRQVMQRFPDGSVHLLNLLDPTLLPYTSFDFSAFPAPNLALIAQAPAPGSPGYATAVASFVQQQAPDTWNGLPVRFWQTFLGSVSVQDAFSTGNANPALLPLLDLELWGVPISAPAYDPANHQFVYQRFQRGIMHYDAACQCTQGILLGDYFKAILTDQHVPLDLAREASGSSYFAQYCPGAPGWLCRPEDLPGSDLTNAFAPE